MKINKKQFYTYAYIFLLLSAVIIISLVIFIPKAADKKIKTLSLQDHYQILPLSLCPKSVKGMFIKDPSTETLAITLIFKGGSALDRYSKEGAVNLFASMLLTGAGNLTSEDIIKYMKTYGIHISTRVDYDNLNINILTVKANLNKAFYLLNLILNQPKFTNSELTIAKNNILLAIKLKEGYTSNKGIDALYKEAFNGNAVFKSGLGTTKSINSLTLDDLNLIKNKIFTQNNLIVGAAGNITKEELEDVLNPIIKPLRPGNFIDQSLKLTPNIQNKIVKVTVPNATSSDIYIAFSMPDVADKNWYPAQLFNQLLGDGDLNSLLMQEVRAKKGLVYTVSSSLNASLYGNLWVIHATTANNKVNDTISAIKSVLSELKTNYVTATQIKPIKNYLEGNYFFNFINNSSKAETLAYMQLNNRSIANIYQRNLLINQVTVQDIKNVIDTYINPNNLLVVVAGG